MCSSIEIHSKVLPLPIFGSTVYFIIIPLVIWWGMQQGGSVRVSLTICLLWYPPCKQMLRKRTAIVMRVAKQTSNRGEDWSTQRLKKFTFSWNLKVMQYFVKTHRSGWMLFAQRTPHWNHPNSQIYILLPAKMDARILMCRNRYWNKLIKSNDYGSITQKEVFRNTCSLHY